MPEAFPLAPMSRSIALLTAALLALPVVFVALGLRCAPAAPLAGVAAFLGLLYTAVWLWCRPSRFEVSSRDLRLHFPARIRVFPRAEIANVRCVDARELRDEFGRAVRIGVGGLWGGFGWLWTRAGLVEFYVSRLDDLVLVERKRGRPLLITPDDPEGFRRALLGGSPGSG